MSDEHFLARWSRRKREATVEPATPAKPDDDTAAKTQVAARDETRTPARGDAATAAPQPAPAAFDPASLPSLDSITEGTDVRGFLASGVPATLTREALRRAWAADPAIRNFRGLQEYDWDFTDPNAMHGFGEIGSDYDIKEMVARVFGEAPEEPQDAATDSATAPSQPVRQASESGPSEDRTVDQVAGPSHDGDRRDPQSGTDESQGTIVADQQPEELLQRNKEAALQHDDLSGSSGQKNRRSHGGALPES